jgi:type IV secretory pathway component VirB8
MSAVQKMRDPQPQDAAKDDDVRRRRQRARNWAIFLVLAAFVTIVYIVTIVKLKGGG